MSASDHPPSTLTSHDVLELTRFSREKTNIDRQIKLIENKPTLEVFDRLRTYGSDDALLDEAERSLAERDSEIAQWARERDATAAQTERFNVSDMNRLRKVAKAASSQGHMSSRDTDLIEITLETIYSLDKLQRHLNNRRATLDLANQRLAWERQLCRCWREYSDLCSDVNVFVEKRARWSSSEYAARVQTTEPPPTQQHESIRCAALAHPDRETSEERKAARSMASWQIAGEMIELEAGRLDLRIKALAQESVAQAGSLLDLIIDQCQVPEAFIDEQERLEYAMPGLLSQGSFATLLAEQWKLADETYRALKTLKHQARSAEVGARDALGAEPNQATRESISSQLSQLLHIMDGLIVQDRQQLGGEALGPPGSSFALKAAVRPPAPLHEAFADQQVYNESVQSSLHKEASSALKRLWLAKAAGEKYETCFQLYSAAGHRVEQVRQAGAALDAAECDAKQGCKRAVDALAGGSTDSASHVDGAATPMPLAEIDALSDHVARLDEALADARREQSDALHAIRRCEAAGLLGARGWLESDAAMASLQSRLQSAADTRLGLVRLVEAAQEANRLKSDITHDEQNAERLLEELVEACNHGAQRIADATTPGWTSAEAPLNLSWLHEDAQTTLATLRSRAGKLAIDHSRLQALSDKVGLASLSNLTFTDSIKGLSDKLDRAEHCSQQCRRLARQVDALKQARAEHEAIRFQLNAAADVIQRQYRNVQRDWLVHLAEATTETAAVAGSLQAIHGEIVRFDQVCVKGAQLSDCSPSNDSQIPDETVRTHLNGLWLQLKASFDDVEARNVELTRLVDVLDRLRELHASFDARKATLVACLERQGESVSSRGGRPKADSMRRSHGSIPFEHTEKLEALEQIGTSLRDYLNCAELQANEANEARTASEARLSELERLQSLKVRKPEKPPSAASRSHPNAAMPKRAQSSQQVLGLGHGPRKQSSAIFSRLRSDPDGSKASNTRKGSDDSALFAKLLARSREGPIPLQTVDEQGRVQQRQLLALPGVDDIDAGELFWDQLRAEAETFERRLSQAPHEKLHTKARLLVRDIAGKSQRFRELCAFASAAAQVDRQQSKLLQLVDSYNGTSPSVHPPSGPEEWWDGGQGASSPAGSSTSVDKRRLEEAIHEIDRLLTRAKGASERVRSDVRVRRRLARLVRSTVEVKDTARATLDPSAEFDPDHSDDGLSVCTFASSDWLDRDPWETSAVGNVPRARSASLGRSSSSLSSSLQLPCTPGRGTRSVSRASSRASTRSPLGMSVVPAERAKEAIGPQTPSRIPRTPRQSRHPSQPARTSSDRVPFSTAPNRYQADPKNRLDVAVGRVVNKLPMAVRVTQAAPSGSARARSGHLDESGQYWVGDPEPKLCFCRILRSKTVMVRIGGGWQELSQFILQHYTHLAGMTITPTSSPRAVQQQTPLSANAASPWLRSASLTTMHPSAMIRHAQQQQQQQQQQNQRSQSPVPQQSQKPATPLSSGSPLNYVRKRVGSMPDGALLGSPMESYRIPSTLRNSTNGSSDRTPSKPARSGLRHATTPRPPSSASVVTLPSGDSGLEGVVDAKLSLF